MFRFRVQLGSNQNDADRQPHPGHEADHGPEGAVGLVELPEVCFGVVAYLAMELRRRREF